MRRVITIVIIVLVCLGFGYFLFRISPQQARPAAGEDFDLSGAKQLSEPGPLVGDDHFLGNKEAKNTLVAYEDLQCPACAVFEPTLKSASSALTDTKVIFRHFPLLGLHKNAAPAAFAAEAAAVQGKFWEFTELVYEKQGEWSDLLDPTEKFVEYAKQAGVANIEQFRNDTVNKVYKERVQRDMVEATGLGVQGTPTLYFNGKPLRIADIEGLKKQIEDQKLYK